MKYILLIFIFPVITNYGFSQVTDSLASKTSKTPELDEKVMVEELKFIKYLGDYRQVLDNQNNLFYINNRGEKELNPIINVYASCGNPANYVYEIIETNKEYILTENIYYDNEKENSPTQIDSISKKGINKIYFAQYQSLSTSDIPTYSNLKTQFNLRKIEFDEYRYNYSFIKIFPFALIIEKTNKKGILYKKKLTFYDDIKYDYDSDLLKVEIKNRYGYFGITECKYAEVNKYVYGLAKFKLPNGETGYIDGEGKEYKD